jgi:adenosine deaminase
MSLETYIRAMPKVDLGLQFEGAVPTASWINLGEMNEIALRSKQIAPVVKALDAPDWSRIEDLYTAVSQWARDPEDLIRLVYDIGVQLAKQNVKYAEIGITPTRYLASDVPFEAFMEALTDGRDRVKRGWGTELAWVFNIPRDEARRADEIVRSANSPAGRKHAVVAVGLVGNETDQQLINYERAFSGAEKKGIARVARVGDQTGAQSINEVLEGLPVSRIVTAWPLASLPELVAKVAEKGITVDVALTESTTMGFVPSIGEYPLRELIAAGVPVTLTASTPARGGQTTLEQYVAAAESCGLTADELDAIVDNAVMASGLEEDRRAALMTDIRVAREAARAEHLS